MFEKIGKVLDRIEDKVFDRMDAAIAKGPDRLYDRLVLGAVGTGSALLTTFATASAISQGQPLQAVAASAAISGGGSLIAGTALWAGGKILGAQLDRLEP